MKDRVRVMSNTENHPIVKILYEANKEIFK